MFKVGDRVLVTGDDRVWIVAVAHIETDTYDLKLESDGSVHQMGVPAGGMRIAS